MRKSENIYIRSRYMQKNKIFDEMNVSLFKFMCYRFNTNILPPEETNEVFGCIQNSFTPSNVSSESYTIEKCKKCDCYLFPTEEKTFDCPICNTSAKYISQAIKIDEKTKLPDINYFYILDLAFPIEVTTSALQILAENMAEHSKAVIIGLAVDHILLYHQKCMPIFDNIVDPEGFIESKLYYLSKQDIQNIIIPALPALYNYVKVDKEQQIDIISALEIVKIQLHHAYYPHNIISLTKREIKPINASTATNAGKSIVSLGGVCHFGAAQSFKRLAAIARFSFGIVFGISTYCAASLRKLFAIPQPLKSTFMMPREIEAEKVTSSDGSVRLTPKLSIISLSAARGSSMKLHCEFPEMPKSLNIVEISQCQNNVYMTVHHFTAPKDAVEFDSSINHEVHHEIQAKAAAADVLRMVFSGTEVGPAIKKLGVEKLFKGTPAEGAGGKPDMDTLLIYFLLHRMPGGIKRQEILGGKGLIFEPTLFLLKSENSNVALSQYDKSEWPLELHLFDDDTTLKLLAATLKA